MGIPGTYRVESLFSGIQNDDFTIFQNDVMTTFHNDVITTFQLNLDSGTLIFHLNRQK